MRRLISTAVLILSGTVCLFAQAPLDKREVRSGNRDFKKENFKEAEIDYRRALVKDSTSIVANYNLANTLYRMQDYEQAGKFIETAEVAENSDIWYNKGDIALQNKDYNTAVDAFKQSLLLNPGDLDAKENYIYAKKMLQNQQQNGGGNNDQNQNQNKNQNQDQNQNKNQDQNQDQNQNKNQDQNQNKDQNQDRQNHGGQQPEMSPQATEQMMQAIAAKEKETQDKVKKEKALRARSNQKEKNW